MHVRDSSAAAASPAKIRKTLGKTSEKSALPSGSPQKYSFGDFQLDLAEQRLIQRGQPVPLRNRPLQVLHYLIQNRGHLVELSELLEAIWGTQDVYHDALRKAVGSVRTALGDDSQAPRYIETHWGKGYRFIGEVIEESPEVIQPPVTAETLPVPFLAKMSADKTTSAPLIRSSRSTLLRVAAGIAVAAVLAGATVAAHNHRSARPANPDPAPPPSSSSTTKVENEAQRSAYHEAQYLLSQRNPENIGRAIGIFKQIALADPHAGDAYAGLAECYALGYWGFWKIDAELAVRESAEYAQKAVLADPGSGYAHAQFAAALLRQLKIRDAQTEFERALAIRPNDAEVHHAYAIFLDDTRRAEAGIQEMKRAIELQPLSLAYKTDLGMSYFFANRYREAMDQYRSVLKLDPNYIEAHEYLASMYVLQAQWNQAKTEYAVIDRLRGGHAGDFRQSPLRLITEFRTGEEKKARTGVQAMLASPSVTQSYDLARVYAQLGKSEDAVRYLSQVVNGHSPEMFSIPDDPLLAPLHGNPQFEVLVSKVSQVFRGPAPEEGTVQAATLILPPKPSGR